MFKSASFLFIFAVCCLPAFSQSTNNYSKRDTLLELRSGSSNSLTERIDLKSERTLQEKIRISMIQVKRTSHDNDKSFDIISTFSDNISFGGFWDKFAVINFSPRFNVNPVGSVSFSGNYNLSCLVPINSIKTYSRTVVVQGIFILAIENAFRLAFEKPGWIIDLVSYVAKNLVINTFMKRIIRNTSRSDNPMQEYEYYSYRISLRF